VRDRVLRETQACVLMERDPASCVRHRVEAIANIDAVGYDFERSRTGWRTRQLVERNLEILSHGSRCLPVQLKEAGSGGPDMGCS
jgi:hypothetical protein